MQLIIVSGRSGSGKSVVLNALEDLGYYCVDNLPIGILPNLIEEADGLHPNIAISIDSRNIPEDLSAFKNTLSQFNNKPAHQCDIIYLDADENTLLKRFSETRRKHPLTNPNTSLRAAIQKEKLLMAPIADIADFTVDTSRLGNHDLHQVIRDRANVTNKPEGFQLLLQSFGFKHGLPPDADFIFDVRCLPNPYWKPGLRALTGLDQDVQQYLESHSTVKEMFFELNEMLDKWITRFKADDRCYLHISIGCTGGIHRSVYFTEKIAEILNKKHDNLKIRHRELKIEK